MQVLEKAPMAETGPWLLSAGVFGSSCPLVDPHLATGEVRLWARNGQFCPPYEKTQLSPSLSLLLASSHLSRQLKRSILIIP